MSKGKPLSEEEIQAAWEEHIEKRKNASEEFKRVFPWMFDFDEFRQMMRLAHLPNPFIQMKRDTK